LQNRPEFAVALDDIHVVVDTFAVVDNAVVHIAAADTVVGIAVAVGIAVVAHSTAVLDIAGTVVGVGFVGLYSHPCMHDPLLWTAYTSAPLSSFQLPAVPPRESLGA